MTSKNKNKGGDAQSTRPPYESQSDRWIKYGSNVLLSAILVVVLAVLLTWFAQRASIRKDMTANGSLSLKPQTINVIKDLKQKITLVSLYSKPDKRPEQAALAQSVSDLLDEYKDKSGKIDVQVIDPIKENDKLEELHQQFISRYGAQIKVYKDYLDDWKKQFGQIKKLTDAEADAIKIFAQSDDPGAEDRSAIAPFVNTIHDVLPDRLSNASSKVERELKKKHPDYKGAATLAKEQMDTVSNLAGEIAAQAPAIMQAKEVPAKFKEYLAASLPNYEKVKTLADDLIAKAGKLGELKVDQLEQALNVENPILVLGENDWRILSQRQVWQDDTDARAINAGAKVKPRFAGEQQITTAIYGLENPKKQKICFVRSGGAPVTAEGFMGFMPSGPLYMIADQLREYNFDVTEKDLSGQWAMQQQMQRQQMPSAPEPSDEQISDAIWIVLDMPQEQQQRGTPPQPSAIGPRLKEHLEHGGSALLLVHIRGDNLADAVKDWGIDLHPDTLALHETIKVSEASAGDMIEQAKGRPFIWDIRRYGDHPIVAPLNNLDSVFVAPIVVSTHPVKGCTITPILPFSENVPGLKTWGDANIDQMEQGKDPEFHPEKGDLSAPIYGGAVVEKQGAGRLVVIGSFQSFQNQFMRLLDPQLARREPPVLVNRFPGNKELVDNSVFWLAHLETMIAISPAAMDVSRIADMSNGMLNFWRIGVLLIVLPGAVLVAGAGVYLKRRD